MSVPFHPPDTRGQLAVAARLLTAVSDTPRLDAELLLAHALGVERSALLLDPDHYGVPEDFAGLVARRLNHEPVAYIVGYRDFWTIRVMVGPGVLVPRPDSETLLEAAVQHFGPRAPRRVLDLGTGPGTLLLAALAQWPGATGLGIDASADALDYARDNAAALDMGERARFALGDWGAGVAERFDLILCNPPYIRSDAPLLADVANHEPAAALFAGADGLDAYRIILPQVTQLLTADGIALLEIGWDQADAVQSLAQAAGLSVQRHRDLGGRDRALLLRAAGPHQ